MQILPAGANSSAKTNAFKGNPGFGDHPASYAFAIYCLDIITMFKSLDIIGFNMTMILLPLPIV